MSHPPSRRRHSTKSPSGSFHQPASFPPDPIQPTSASLCFPSIPPSPSILSLLALLVDQGDELLPSASALPRRRPASSETTPARPTSPPFLSLYRFSLSLSLFLSLSLCSTSPHGLSFFRTNKGLAMATGWSSAAMEPRLHHHIQPASAALACSRPDPAPRPRPCLRRQSSRTLLLCFFSSKGPAPVKPAS